MKTKFYTILAFLFVTVSITAQIDRSQQPKPSCTKNFARKANRI